jgi:hypothetical protein
LTAVKSARLSQFQSGGHGYELLQVIEGDTMTSVNKTAAATSLAARCYRLTDKGRACVAVVEAETQTLGSLSRHMHDVLAMCGTGVWFDQLRQFMPPRSLDESLRMLLSLQLIEPVDDAPPPRPVDIAPPRARQFPVRTLAGPASTF